MAHPLEMILYVGSHCWCNFNMTASIFKFHW
jgi:hypothetical protein